MGEVAQLVAVEFGGALKAEHGTGRNMAPFVELEWGSEAYALMWKIKRCSTPTASSIRTWCSPKTRTST